MTQDLIHIIHEGIVQRVTCHHQDCTATGLRLIVDPYFAELYTQDEIDKIDDADVRKWTCDEHEQDLYDAI